MEAAAPAGAKAPAAGEEPAGDRSRARPPWPATAVRRCYLALAFAFVALVALRLHGFSLPFWHIRLDGSPAPEVLLGEAREQRWDDWVVQLPLALAQHAHEPPFPLVNRNVGLGQNMLVPILAPVAHPLVLVRPLQWGWFLGPDVGLAWLWWGQALGLFAVLLGVGLVLTDGRLALAAAGAALVVFAPFLQFYSLNAAPHALFFGASWLAAVGVLRGHTPFRIVASGVLLGWAGACFALSPYPPFQVVLGHLFWVLLAGWSWSRRRELSLRVHLGWRVAALALAGLLFAVAAVAFWLEVREEIATLAASRYPGQRVARGGAHGLWQLWTAYFAWPLQVDEPGPLGPYVSSTAGFLLCWPLLAAALAGRAWRERVAPGALPLGLVAYCAVLTAWSVFGLPAPLARASGLALVPSERAWLGLGIADALLLVVVLAAPSRRPGGSLIAALGAGVWAFALALAARRLHAALPGTMPLLLALLVAAHGAWAFGVLRGWRPALLTGAAAAGLAVSTLWFNPLVRGGSAWLAENPLSRALLEVDRAAGGDTAWVSYGDQHVANLVRAIGLRALNGVLPVPQPELWARIDPDGREREHYDRFAHVYVGLARPGHRFGSTQDVLGVYADPDEGVLERLGATHLLVRLDEPRLAIRFGGYLPEARVGAYAIYALPLRRRAAEVPRP